MSSGLDMLAVFAGGTVLTFFAVAVMEMIRKGRALRARAALEEAEAARPLDGGAAPPPPNAAGEPAPARREGPSGP